MHNEGKPYVLDALRFCQNILEGWEGAGDPFESAKAQLQEVLEKLEAVKDKIYLKSKKGLNDAYLLAEGAKALEEAVEELKASDPSGGSAREELSTQLSALVTNVDALHAAAKSRSIVIT